MISSGQSPELGPAVTVDEAAHRCQEIGDGALLPRQRARRQFLEPPGIRTVHRCRPHGCYTLRRPGSVSPARGLGGVAEVTGEVGAEVGGTGPGARDGVIVVPRELDPGDVGSDGSTDVTPAGVCVGPAAGTNSD